MVCAICALVAAALAAFAAVNPFHLRWGGPATAVLVGLTIALVTAAAAVVPRRRANRIVTAVLGTLILVGWCAAAIVGLRFSGPQRDVTTVAAGNYRLVVVEGHAFVDTVYSVHLRRGSGPLEQDSLVWQGLAEGSPPAQVRFHGDPAADQQVEVVAGPGCGYRSRYDSHTLAVDPVHRPLRLDGC